VVLLHGLGYFGYPEMVDLLTILPSGKLSHSYGKSPFLMGKLTINGHFQ